MSGINLLENGLKWLSEKQKSHVSSKVLYQTPDQSFEVNAVLGRTRYEITDDYGFKISAHSIDFLISSTELGIVPKVGHRIVYRGKCYEICRRSRRNPTACTSRRVPWVHAWGTLIRSLIIRRRYS